MGTEKREKAPLQPGAMFINYLSSCMELLAGHGAPFTWSHFKNDFHAMNTNSPEAQMAARVKFNDSMNLSVKPLKNVLTEYLDKKVKDTSAFSGIKFTTIPDKTVADAVGVESSFGAALTPGADGNLSDAQKTIKRKIEAALKLSKHAEELGKKFDRFNTFLTQIQAEDSAEAVSNELSTLKGEIFERVDKLHKKDVEEIEKLFKDPEFLEAMKTEVLKIADPTKADDKKTQEALDKIKADMLKSVNDKHNELFGKEKREAANKELDNAIKDLNLKIAQEQARIFFLAKMYEAHKDNLKGIVLDADLILTDDPAEFAKANAGLLKNVKIEDFPEFKTKSGLIIKSLGPGQGLSIELPNRMSLYSHSANDNIRNDLMSLAFAIKATSKKIKMTVTHDKPEYAQFMAQQAYEACILAGFDPKDIKVGVKVGTQTEEVLDHTKLSVQSVEAIIDKYKADRSAQNVDSQKNVKRKYSEFEKTTPPAATDTISDTTAPKIS